MNNKRKNRNVTTIQLNMRTEMIDNLIYYELLIAHDKFRTSNTIKIWNACLREHKFSKIEKEKEYITQKDLFEIYKLLLEQKKKIKTPFINLEFVRDFKTWVIMKRYKIKYMLFILKSLKNYYNLNLKNRDFNFDSLKIKLKTPKDNEFILTKDRLLKLKFPNSNILLTFFEHHFRMFNYFRSVIVFIEYDRPNKWIVR